MRKFTREEVEQIVSVALELADKPVGDKIIDGVQTSVLKFLTRTFPVLIDSVEKGEDIEIFRKV